MLVLLETAFPRYEHAHNIDELFPARDYSRFTLRLPHGVNIKGGCRLSCTPGSS